LAGPVPRAFRHRDAESFRRVADAQSFCDAPAAIHGVHAIGVGYRNDIRVEEGSPFPRGPEAYAPWGARGERHEAASQQALQVHGEIESLTSQQASELDIVLHCGQRIYPRGSTIERQRLIEIGMALEQGLVSAVDDPGNVSHWKPPTERGQDGQGVNDVAERAGLNDGDAPGGVLAQKQFHVAIPFAGLLPSIPV
jgi:hypothetical protein